VTSLSKHVNLFDGVRDELQKTAVSRLTKREVI